jgi:very-short-patch-repair endonuclease
LEKQRETRRKTNKKNGYHHSPETIEKIRQSFLSRAPAGGMKFFNTKPELKMGEVLKSLNRVYKPQQYVAGCKIDFLLEDLNLVIECDGDYWHANPKKYAPDFYNKKMKMTAVEIWERDAQRTKQLEDAGYKVIRFWEQDFNENSVREAIEQTCWEPVEGLLV